MELQTSFSNRSKSIFAGKTRAILLLVGATSLPLVPKTQADVVTVFNFNSSTLASTAGQSSTMTTTGFVSTNVTYFSGSTVNAYTPPGGTTDFAGMALALQGGAGVTSGGTGGNNGGSILFSVSGTNLSNFDVSYATQKSGTTGFGTQALSYSTDGTNYTQFGTFAPTAAFTRAEFNLSSITSLNNAATVYFELTFTGASASAGNNRIDNLQVTTVPEPTTVLGSALLVGAAGWSLRRRKRTA